jgi:hypothetical protein
MRGWWTAAWLACAVGCSPYRKPLLESEFKEVCPGGNPSVAWLRFEPGRRFDWSYTQGGPWTPGDDETWKIKAGVLILSWNDGYAVNRIELEERKGTTAPGTSTKNACVSTVHLDWVGKRTDR